MSKTKTRRPARPSTSKTTDTASNRLPSRCRTLARPVKASTLQSVLTWTARRDRHARELAAVMRVTCSACDSSLASHVGAGNMKAGRP